MERREVGAEAQPHSAPQRQGAQGWAPEVYEDAFSLRLRLILRAQVATEFQQKDLSFSHCFRRWSFHHDLSRVVSNVC